MKTVIRKDRDGNRIILERDDTLRFYYHITREDWGDSVILWPQDEGKNRAWDEPKIGRTCVAPSIQLCFCAIDADRNMFAYRTKNPLTGFYPEKVGDYRMTGERWLLYPTRFIRVWYVPTEVCAKMMKFGEGVQLGSDELCEKRRQYRLKKKVLDYFKGITLPIEAGRCVV